MLAICLFAGVALAASATDAFASHFRYGTITWTVVNPAKPNVVTIRFESAWRLSYEQWIPATPTAVGQVVTTGFANLGQIMVRNASGVAIAAYTPSLKVTALNSAEDWFAATYEATVTFPAATANYTATFTACCRVSTLRDNNADRDYMVKAGITVKMPPNPVNQPPTSATVPIITLAKGRPARVQLPASDPNGDVVSFRLATFAESGLVNAAPLSPAPGTEGAFSLSESGLVEWTPQINGLYAVQVRLGDPGGAYTAIDLIFSVITANGEAPAVRIDGQAAAQTFRTVHGTPFSFDVAGTDPEHTPIALSSSGLPVGSTMTPSLPMTAVNAASTFTWTPAASAVGTYVMSFAALDGAGLQSTNSVTLIVTNNPPTIDCTTNGPSLEATGAAGASFAITAAVNDADPDKLTIRFFVDGIEREVASLLPPPATRTFSASLGFGSHTYEARVDDGLGTRSCTGAFTVRDTTAPSIVVDPGHQTLAAISAAGAAATFTVSAHDEVDGQPQLVCPHSAGDTYPIGVTTVVCSATDASGNRNEATFIINVIDAEAPVIEPHADVAAEATGGAGATVSYTSPITRDAIDGDGVATCAPASGSTFRLGVTTVSCSAADAFGNRATESVFTITVVDTTAPAIDFHGDETAEATGPVGAVVAYAAPATHDAVDGDLFATCDPISGSTFPIGASTVTCSATDARGNVATKTTFKVSVVDTTAPTIYPHADETAEATAASGAIVNYDAPGTHDVVDGERTASCTPASGTTFPLGESTVTCAATDAHSNAAPRSTFKVFVVDTTAPTIDPRGHVSVHATSPSGAIVVYASPATRDAVSGNGLANCSPASGSTFPIGATTITCSATDAHGNAGIATTFTVSVTNTAPIFTPPADVTAEATGAAGAALAFSASGHDDEQGSIPAVCSALSGTTFGLGTTTVTCTVTDVAGASASGSFRVTVRDTTAPAITAVTPSTGVLARPNHQMELLTIAVAATDAVTSAPACSVTDVSSNESQNGTGDGNSSEDWSITGPLTLELRSERAGNGTGRIYTVAVRCSDEVGNASSATTTVSVTKPSAN